MARTLAQYNDPAEFNHKILIYGGPKTGKTEAAGVFALSGLYDIVYWFDLENGAKTLMKLESPYKDRVYLIAVEDNAKNPRGIHTIMKVAEASTTRTALVACDYHGAVNCTVCNGKLARHKKDPETIEEPGFTPIEFPEDKRILIVVDSLTQLSTSAMNRLLQKDGIDLSEDTSKKITFNHYGAQGVLLDRCLTDVQSTKVDCLFISHEKELSQEDDKSKLGPVGGTTNFSKSVSKYFDHVVRFEISNKQHNANSTTVANAKVVAGSRTDAKVMEGGQIVLANLLKHYPRSAIEEGKKGDEAKAALSRRPAGGLRLGSKS